MKNETEYAKGSAVAEQQLRKAPERENPFAEARYEVFNPELVKLGSPAGGVFVNTYTHFELLFELQQLGMPAGLACLFMQMLWQAHPDLNHAIFVTTLATKTGKLRPSVQRSIRELQKIGIISQVMPVTKPARWRFQKYHDLIESVKLRYRTDG